MLLCVLAVAASASASPFEPAAQIAHRPVEDIIEGTHDGVHSPPRLACYDDDAKPRTTHTSDTSDAHRPFVFQAGLLVGVLACGLGNFVYRRWWPTALFTNSEPTVLCFACSPKAAPCPAALDECLEVSHVVPAAIYKDGTPDCLQNLLNDVPTRIFMFSGHTNLNFHPDEEVDLAPEDVETEVAPSSPSLSPTAATALATAATAATAAVAIASPVSEVMASPVSALCLSALCARASAATAATCPMHTKAVKASLSKSINHLSVAMGVPVGDAVSKARPQPCSKTLGFTSPEGDMVMVPPEDVIEMLASHSIRRGGKLEMVVLNGCQSEPLGRALRDAGVPYVLCWKTLVPDAAANLAITTFFREMHAGRSFESAFIASKRALLFKTRRGVGAGGAKMRTPMYEIRDPEGLIAPAERRRTPLCTPAPVPTGLCLLLTPEGEYSW